MILFERKFCPNGTYFVLVLCLKHINSKVFLMNAKLHSQQPINTT